MPILIIGVVALVVFSAIGILLFTAGAAERHEREQHPDSPEGHRAA
jgi:hypothetical protein